MLLLHRSLENFAQLLAVTEWKTFSTLYFKQGFIPK